MLKTLADWGIGRNILAYVKGFLSDRSFEVMVGGNRSRVFHVETGVPQGSVLAVTLFLIAMNGIFANLPKGIHVMVYANDILLVVVGNIHRAPCRTLQA